MAKKNLQGSFADELRSAAYIWLGNTNIENNYILLVNFHKATHWVVVENNEKDITLRAPKATIALSQDIFTALYEVYPTWKKKGQGAVESDLPEDLSIVSDCNDIFYEKDIKPLKQTTVVPLLYNLGIDITKYEYTSLVIDNSHTLSAQPIVRGYENYPKEVLKYMVDTSKYKDYTITKKDEYEMLDIGCYRGIIAAGGAGGGKTTDGFTFAGKVQAPMINFQCVHNTEADDIIGKYVPATDKYASFREYFQSRIASEDTSEDEKIAYQKSLDSLPPVPTGFEFLYGPLALAVKYDCLFSGEEWNYAPSAVQSVVNSLMDGNGRMTLPNGEVLTVGPNFRMILTVNPGYRGTNMFNEATLNRFATVYYEPISKKTLIERLKLESGYKNEKVLEAIAEQFDKLRGIYQSKNMETEVTYRNAARFLRMILLAPDKSLEKQFDIAFINSTLFEMNDIETELKDLKDIRKVMLNDIKDALAEGTKEVTEASWTCTPQVDLDGLTSQIGDDGSFLNVEEEEA
jgi:MoxR-like ATPase